MKIARFGFFALTILAGAAILIPVFLPGIASADCGVNGCNYDRGQQCAFHGQLLRCESNETVGDYDRAAIRDCDNCSRLNEYRCGLYGCGWGQ